MKTLHWLASPSIFEHLTPALPIVMTDGRKKGMWLGWCPNLFTGSIAWSQEMASSGNVSAIARSLSWEALSLTIT